MRSIRFLILLACTLAAASLRAQTTLTWGTGGAGGSGTWSTDTTNVDWYNGTANVPWTDGDNAVFGGTAGTVTISSSVTTPHITFTTPGYTLQTFFLDGSSTGLTVEADADATISAPIFSSGSNSTPFTKTGSGALTISGGGEPSFFGSVNVAAGELRYAGGGSPDFTTPYVLANAAGVALTFSASSNEIGSLGGGGTSGGVVRPNVTSGSLSLSIYGNSDANFAGTIQDNGSASLAFQKSGASTQTLSGANTFSGAVRVSGGTLNLANTNTYVGATTVSGTTYLTGTTATLTGGALVLSGANGTALNTASVSVSSNGTLLLDNSGAANSQRLAAAVPVSLANGTLGLTGNATTNTSQTFTGAVTFSGASAVNATPTGTATAQFILSGGLTRQNSGTLSFSGGNTVTVAGLTNTNGIVGAYATVNGTDWATVDGSGRVSAYTGYTSDLTTASSTDNLRITSTGAGAGGTLPKSQARNSLDLVNTGTSSGLFQIGPTQTLTLTSGGLLTSGSAGFTVQNGTLTTPGSELLITNQAALTMAATIIDGGTAVSLTKSGVGTLALLGNNTYTGNTTVVQGTVQAAAAGNLGTGSAVVLSGGTLQATGGFTSAKSLQGSGGTVDTGSNNVAFTGGNNTGNFNKVGSGMLSLTNATGNATVVNGVLHLTNPTTANSSSVSVYGGRLEASGNVGSVFTSSGAEISPGSIGQAAALTIGSLNPGFSNAVIDFDLGSGTTDTLALSTRPFLFGGTNPLVLFRFGNLGGTQPGTAYTLLNFPASGSSLNVAEFGFDPASTAAGYKGTFTLTGTTLSVTFSAVPEPGAWVWLLAAAVVGGVARKRRA